MDPQRQRMVLLEQNLYLGFKLGDQIVHTD